MQVKEISIENFTVFEKLKIDFSKGINILIGENIEVSIISIEGSSVKIGIKAPKNLQILRKELYIEVENENKNALAKNIDIIKDFTRK